MPIRCGTVHPGPPGGDGRCREVVVETGAFVHDPTLMREGDRYYVFSTGSPRVGGGGVQVRVSEDLRHWRFVGVVPPEIPTWVRARVAGVRSLWAPDISWYSGRYQLYYAGSLFGKNTSVIGLATNATLDPEAPNHRWVDRGLVVETTGAEPWNAIDPNFALDGHGAPWLVFGSFWSGIQLVRLDPATGRPAGAAPHIHALARRPDPPHAVEAPCIIHRAPYHYLFVSFDMCCRGLQSTYRIAVGRSVDITGPYLDAAGRPMLEGGGTVLLATDGPAIGPGGQSVYCAPEADLLVYHYYDGADNGRPRLEIRALEWSAEGWPLPGPPLVGCTTP